jgi:hypothetical protein
MQTRDLAAACLGAFTDRFPVQIRYSISSHDVADQTAGSHDSSTGIEHGHHAGNRSVPRGRRDRNNWFATLRPRSPAEKIHLPADTAVELAADRVGADLSSQIDLQRRVDRYHLRCKRGTARMAHIMRLRDLNHDLDLGKNEGNW